MDAPEDCRRCGACCYSQSERHVAVTGADWERLGPDADRVAHFIGNRAFMRMDRHHCVALEISDLPNGQHVFACAVYARRPQICRDLGRGTPECEGERLLKAPLLPGQPPVTRAHA